MTLFTLYVATRCSLRRIRKSLRNEHALRRMHNECQTLRALIHHVDGHVEQVARQAAELEQELDDCRGSLEDKVSVDDWETEAQRMIEREVEEQFNDNVDDAVEEKVTEAIEALAVDGIPIDECVANVMRQLDEQDHDAVAHDVEMVKETLTEIKNVLCGKLG